MRWAVYLEVSEMVELGDGDVVMRRTSRLFVSEHDTEQQAKREADRLNRHNRRQLHVYVATELQSQRAGS